jgi:hypothetical protein
MIPDNRDALSVVDKITVMRPMERIMFFAMLFVSTYTAAIGYLTAVNAI